MCLIRAGHSGDSSVSGGAGVGVLARLFLELVVAAARSDPETMNCAKRGGGGVGEGVESGREGGYLSTLRTGHQKATHTLSHFH